MTSLYRFESEYKSILVQLFIWPVGKAKTQLATFCEIRILLWISVCENVVFKDSKWTETFSERWFSRPGKFCYSLTELRAYKEPINGYNLINRSKRSRVCMWLNVLLLERKTYQEKTFECLWSRLKHQRLYQYFFSGRLTFSFHLKLRWKLLFGYHLINGLCWSDAITNIFYMF